MGAPHSTLSRITLNPGACPTPDPAPPPRGHPTVSSCHDGSRGIWSLSSQIAILIPAARAARGQRSCSTQGSGVPGYHARNQGFHRRLGAEKLHIQIKMSLFLHSLCSGFEIEKKGSIGFIICSAAFFADGLLIKYLNYLLQTRDSTTNQRSPAPCFDRLLGFIFVADSY